MTIQILKKNYKFCLKNVNFSVVLQSLDTAKRDKSYQCFPKYPELTPPDPHFDHIFDIGKEKNGKKIWEQCKDNNNDNN